MKVKVDGRETPAEVHEYRCRDFVSAEFYVNGKAVGLAETLSENYELTEASDRERELLACWGFRIWDCRTGKFLNSMV